MSLEEDLKEVLQDRRRKLGEPPSFDSMIAFREGRLSEAEKEKLLEYAAVDPDTAQTLLDVIHFPNLRSVAELSAEDQEAEWQRLREHIPQLQSPAHQPTFEPKTASWLRPWGQLAAALILMASVSFFAVNLRQPVEPSFHPLITPVLFPEGSEGTRSVESAEFAEESEWLIVRLALEHVESYPRYRVELSGPDGQIQWQADTRTVRLDRLELAVPRSILFPGRWKIALSGLEGESSTFLDHYALSITR